MDKKENNYAFIDSQNVNMGVEELVGYLPENQNLYANLQKYGYVLVFKPVMKDGSGKPKGNVDADLVLRTMVDYDKYDKAVIVSSDGDFYSLVEHLYAKQKLEAVLSPNKEKCSILLQKKARERMFFMDTLRSKLEYIKR